MEAYNDNFTKEDLEALHRMEVALAKLNEMSEEEKEDYLLNIKRDFGTLDIDLSELD